jgi:hypothetical protein
MYKISGFNILKFHSTIHNITSAVSAILEYNDAVNLTVGENDTKRTFPMFHDIKKYVNDWM